MSYLFTRCYSNIKYLLSFLSFIWVVSSIFGCLGDVDSSSSLSSSIRGENCTVLVVMSPGYHAHSFYSYEVDSWFVFFCHFGCSEWTCHLFNLFVIWRIWIGMLPIRFIFVVVDLCCTSLFSEILQSFEFRISSLNTYFMRSDFKLLVLVIY